MHQSDTYTTQATNDKDEAAPVGAAGKAETDMVEGDMVKAVGAGEAETDKAEGAMAKAAGVDSTAEGGAGDDAAADMAEGGANDDAGAGMTEGNMAKAAGVDGTAEVGASDDAAADMADGDMAKAAEADIATAVNFDDAQPGDPDSQYDQHAKFLLGHKIILAHILAALIEEFHGMEPKDILPYIEGDIHIGRVPIDPGKTNTVLLSDTDASTDTNTGNDTNTDTGTGTDTNSPRIIGLRNENSEPNEGLIYFDILFSLLLPNRQLPDKRRRSRKTADRLLRAIVDIEAQKDEPTTYKLMNRCIFYVCRLVSSQKERDFVKMHFDDLCRSYSIWICMNAKADYVEYTSLHQTMLLGTCHTKGSLDLINIIVIGLEKEKEDRPTGAAQAGDTIKAQTVEEAGTDITNVAEADTNPYRRLHRLLRVLFSTTLSKTEKLDILEKEFSIVQGAYDTSMIESLRKETDTMCNLSQAVKEIGIEIGKKEGIDIGRSEGISIGRSEGIQIGESKAKRNLSLSLAERGMTIDEIATLLDESIALVQEWLNGGMAAVE